MRPEVDSNHRNLIVVFNVIVNLVLDEANRTAELTYPSAYIQLA